ncbi:MAG: exopolysaccharide biosynthesis protein [Alphaproteobacteria bacterium]|nr:exopolysaccharide biosynthesis protein [Alphaproteobacteria bacterium]
MPQREPPRRTSDILREISHRPGVGALTLRQVLDQLDDRAAGLFILIFALPATIPIPGFGGSLITSLPIALMGLRMVLGKTPIWLPDRLAYRQFSPASMALRIERYMPILYRLEHYLTPRMGWVCSRRMDRVLGALFLLLSCISALPVPGGNFLPGIAMVLMAVGMMEKDGLFVLCAILFALVCLVLMQPSATAALAGYFVRARQALP